MKGTHVLGEDHFHTLFTSPGVLAALREGYVNGYLAMARQLRDSPTTRSFILFRLQYQPYAQMTQEQKVAQADAALQALHKLLHSVESHVDPAVDLACCGQSISKSGVARVDSNDVSEQER